MCEGAEVEVGEGPLWKEVVVTFEHEKESREGESSESLEAT